MRKKLLFLIFWLVLIFSSVDQLRAQSADWQPIYLLVTGGNTMNGVEASFTSETCSGEEIIHIKFNNHNQYPVKLEWFDAVFTQELKWINKDQPADKKSITLPAHIERKGACLINEYPVLSIKVNDFVSDKNDFKRYSASHLVVIPLQ